MRYLPLGGFWPLVPCPLPLLVFFIAACGSDASSNDGEEWVWDLPEQIPAPRVPEDNPMTVEKVDTTAQLADLFTKALPREPFERLRSALLGW